MPTKSKIEWTEVTLNLVTGCTMLSPGCKNCYALRFAERFRGIRGHHFEQGFDLRLWPDRLELPHKWKKPRRIFLNSMSDTFHKAVPDEFIQKIFDMVDVASHHTFQMLTKRSDRLVEMAPRLKFPSNLWVGVSVESDKYLYRAEDLRQVPAAVRFLSLEPLLGPLPNLNLDGIDWVIVGGESGPGFRTMDPDWAREIRDKCVRAKVPFFFKQWSGVHPKSLGRLLDGREWNEFPKDRQAMTIR